MFKSKVLIVIFTHAFVGLIGFALGIYLLPILTAPPAPSAVEIKQQMSDAKYQARFKKELRGSDLLHYGEGEVRITADKVTFLGKISPGPDFKLYFSPKFVETKEDFLRLKPKMVRVGDVNTFENFIVEIPSHIDAAQYNSVIVWCESFSQFITAAQYQMSSAH